MLGSVFTDSETRYIVCNWPFRDHMRYLLRYYWMLPGSKLRWKDNNCRPQWLKDQMGGIKEWMKWMSETIETDLCEETKQVANNRSYLAASCIPSRRNGSNTVCRTLGYFVHWADYAAATSSRRTFATNIFESTAICVPQQPNACTSHIYLWT